MEEFDGSFLTNDLKEINLEKKRKCCSKCLIINIFLIIVIACLIIFILIQNKQEKGGIKPIKEEEKEKNEPKKEEGKEEEIEKEKEEEKEREKEGKEIEEKEEKEEENEIEEKEIEEKEIEEKEEEEKEIEEKEEKEEKKEKEDEKEVEEREKEGKYNDFYDIISKEELIKARNSFKQFNYIDLESNGEPKYLPYNLFIPVNYTKSKKYPLMIFMSDESLIGNEVTYPLIQTIGGPIWATDLVQNKNKCFVLIPKYSENIIDDKGNFKIEYLNITKRLIFELGNKFNLDINRIYGTGQSIGAMGLLYLLSNNAKLLTASILINGFYMHDELSELINTTFTFISSKENVKSFNSQKEIKDYFDSYNISYGLIDNISNKEDIEALNQKVKYMLYKNYRNNFITYSGGKNLVYKFEEIRDWIFLQNKVECKEGYFFSEEEGKCFTKSKKKILFLIRDKSSDSILLKLLNNLTFISEITIKNYKDILEKTESFFSPFDCVIYDITDEGTYSTLKNDKEIESYIKKGGSFLVTHDRWDEDIGPLYLLDCQRDDRNFKQSISRKAKVSYFNHPILDSYYNLTNWREIDIAETHKTYHKIIDRANNTVKVVMEFDIEDERGIKYDYLLANELGKGRIVHWEAGHSSYTISKDEQILFINIISWLNRIKQ